MSEASLPKAALLCIDDDQAVLECEKAFLETFGYIVVTASSGPEGLKLAGHHSFDVVIVDCNMPTTSRSAATPYTGRPRTRSIRN